MEIIKILSNNGIVVSLGHTTSDMEISIQAVKNGATLITHLFNAMRSVGILYNITTTISTNCVYSFIIEIQD